MPTYTVGAPDHVSGGIDAKGVRRYTHVYKVESSVINDGPLDIINQSPYTYYSAHPSDLLALLKDARAEQDQQERHFWTLTLNWDTDRTGQDAGTAQPGMATAPASPGTNNSLTPPNQRPWVLKWGSVQRTKILKTDLSEPPQDVKNSSGQYFDPPVEIPSANPTLHITGWRTDAQPLKVAIYMNTVNAAAFMNWDAGYARVTSYEITSQYENGAFFYQVDITIEFNSDKWNPIRVLDVGTTIIKTADETPLNEAQPIKDASGNPITAPVPLDNNGGRLPLGSDLEFREFQGYQETDFDNLI